MRVSTSPQVVSSKRPASDKGKGDRSSRSLSPRSHCPSMSLAPSLLLCAQLWALTHQLQQQLLTGNKIEKDAPGLQAEAVIRPETTHLGAAWSARVASRRGKSLRGHIQLCVVESPFVYTRVIDGWGSFWPRLVHFALQRVPPSQSQTTMHKTI